MPTGVAGPVDSWLRYYAMLWPPEGGPSGRVVLQCTYYAAVQPLSCGNRLHFKLETGHVNATLHLYCPLAWQTWTDTTHHLDRAPNPQSSHMHGAFTGQHPAGIQPWCKQCHCWPGWRCELPEWCGQDAAVAAAQRDCARVWQDRPRGRGLLGWLWEEGGGLCVHSYRWGEVTCVPHCTWNVGTQDAHIDTSYVTRILITALCFMHPCCAPKCCGDVSVASQHQAGAKQW